MSVIIKRVWNQNNLVNIESLHGMTFQAESGGHTFRISGIDDTGASVSLSGTVSAVFRRPDNADIALTGSASGGVVSVTLSNDCYAVAGRFGLTIFVTSNGQKVAVYACVGTVAQTTGGAVAGSTPQDVVDLINAIAAAVASIPADYTDLIASIAPSYSNSALYAVGSYAWYSGHLYRCTTPITTAESWTAAHWTAAVLTGDMTKLSGRVDVLFEDETINLANYVSNKISINSSSKWTVIYTASNNTSSKFIPIPDDAYEIKITPQSGSVIAFLPETYHPVNNEAVVFAPGYNSRITFSNTQQVTYKVTPGMKNMLVLYTNTAGTNVAPTSIVFNRAKSVTDSRWLQAIDDETTLEADAMDMSGVIMSLLNKFGYCHLGEGIFYVSGIDMPESSMLCGCGDKTQVRLLSSVTRGYCVKLNNYCTIKDVSFDGLVSTAPTTEGTRDGIRFVGAYSGTPRERLLRSVIDNVIVRNFSGSGLLCYDTSISPEHGLYAVNLYCFKCYAGINIRGYSEFNKFTNICTNADCYYGIINNSGNNVFTACTIRAAYIGFYINGQAYNTGHGTLNGCTFCHIGNNQGSAITIDDVTAGFVIANCQFWYNSIDVGNSQGIMFYGCEFGAGTTGSGATININGGNLVMFASCVFMNDVEKPPVFTITDNTKVKLDACYGAVSGNAISLAA